MNEGTNWATQPVVTVEDANGNTVTTATGTVTLAIASTGGHSGGSAQGTLACTTNTVTAVAGVATFAGCKITGPGGRHLHPDATAAGLTSATTNNVTITAGAATQLVVHHPARGRRPRRRPSPPSRWSPSRTPAATR